jgi:epoxyqueuosine reductase
LLQLNKKELYEITEEVFQVIFKNSPVKRTKFKGLKRNLEFLKPV